MAQYAAALDQGTTSTRCMIFDHGGQVVAIDQLEHEQIFPQAGWVEHDPAEVWQRTRQVMDAALTKSRANASDIAALGVTNQRETTVVWDKNTGEAVYNAIVWQDTRTDKICAELEADGGQDRFRETTGLPIATYFSGPKVRWILDNVEGTRERAEAGDLLFGNMDTWCIWNLTGGVNGGVHITDVSNASRTLLMDLKTLDWAQANLDAIGVPRAMLPEIRPSSETYGEVKLGGFEGTPIAGDLGDQQAATFGQVCFSVGEAKNTYGTGNFLLLNTGTEAVQSKNGLITTVGYKIGDQHAVYCLEGSIAVTGSLVQWLRDNLKMIRTSDEVGVAGQDGRRQRRLLHRAGVLGPVRAVLEVRRARRVRGPDPVHQRGPHRPGHARGDGVPEPRGGRRHERGLRRPARVAPGRRRHGRQRDPHAVPGRHPRRAGDPAAGRRDDGAGRRLRRRARDRVLGRARRTCARTGPRTSAGSPQMDESQRAELYAYWKKAVTRTFDWLD